MDPRVREHAEIIANHCVDLEEGDDVVIDAHPEADDLVTALHEVIGDAGANPLAVTYRFGWRYRRAYLRNHDEAFEVPDHIEALFEEMDTYIAIYSGDNVAETNDVPSDVEQAYNKMREPLLNTRLSKTWVLTQYPCDAWAQLAGMSTEGYENFVWDAISKDWDAVREHQEQLVDVLEDGSEVRIVSGDTTDVTMSIEGNHPENDYGEVNLPGGEVFTAPVRDSVDGEVLYDVPIYHEGNEMEDVHLVFEDGEVVEYSAGTGEDHLDDLLTTDEGAKYLGELGIGMNRDIDRPTKNILFDEKMGDTVHMAVGRAYKENVGEDNERNASAVHVDFICDMSEDSYIEVDGEVVQRNGTFVFEDGFEDEA